MRHEVQFEKKEETKEASLPLVMREGVEMRTDSLF